MGERVRSCPFAILCEGGDKANQDVRARHECQGESQANRLAFVDAHKDAEQV